MIPGYGTQRRQESSLAREDFTSPLTATAVMEADGDVDGLASQFGGGAFNGPQTKVPRTR